MGGGIFRRFRSPDAAAAAIGARVIIDDQTWQCTGHNDLGCLYWIKVRPSGLAGIRQYVNPTADAAYERGL